MPASWQARGRNGGRRLIPADEPRVVLANKLFADKTLRVNDISKTLNISRTTFYRYVQMK